MHPALHRFRADGQDIRINTVEGFFQRSQYCGGSLCRPDNHEETGVRPLVERGVECGLNVCVGRTLVDVVDDADDFDRRLGRIKPNGLSERVFPGEILLRKFCRETTSTVAEKGAPGTGLTNTPEILGTVT